MLEDSRITLQVEAGRWAATPISLMSAVDVWIGYNQNDQGRITEVLLTNDQNEWAAKNKRFHNTTGRCFADWCQQITPLGSDSPPAFGPDQCFDPAGVFGTLLAYGFVTREAYRDALYQFARIRECPWARRMLLAFDGEMSEVDLSQPF